MTRPTGGQKAKRRHVAKRPPSVFATFRHLLNEPVIRVLPAQTRMMLIEILTAMTGDFGGVFRLPRDASARIQGLVWLTGLLHQEVVDGLAYLAELNLLTIADDGMIWSPLITAKGTLRIEGWKRSFGLAFNRSLAVPKKVTSNPFSPPVVTMAAFRKRGRSKGPANVI